MGIMFAILIKMVPKHHCSFVVGVFIFIMNNVGGNLPVAIDPLAKLIGYRQALYIFYPGALLLSMNPSKSCVYKKFFILFIFARRPDFLIRCCDFRNYRSGTAQT